MEKLTSFIFFVFIISFLHAQPCKKVKPGMSKVEVLKAVGTPIEIDTLGYDNFADRKGLMVVWQYGAVNKDGNQRVSFTDNKVSGEVIADGLKYDELMKQFTRKEITYKEYQNRLKKMNKENCK